jgi:hypothetical protein
MTPTGGVWEQFDLNSKSFICSGSGSYRCVYVDNVCVYVSDKILFSQPVWPWVSSPFQQHPPEMCFATGKLLQLTLIQLVHPLPPASTPPSLLSFLSQSPLISDFSLILHTSSTFYCIFISARLSLPQKVYYSSLSQSHLDHVIYPIHCPSYTLSVSECPSTRIMLLVPANLAVLLSPWPGQFMKAFLRAYICMTAQLSCI